MNKEPRRNAKTSTSGRSGKTSRSIGVHSRALAVSPNLFDRIVSILEQARGNVVRAVNTNMVLAYWLIGREIVVEIQSGKGRAKYGEKVIEDLSVRLTERYGAGFSEQSLQNFRRFYLIYAERVAISSPLGRKSGAGDSERSISRPGGVKCVEGVAIPSPAGRELTHSKKSYPMGDEFHQGFSPQLSWSHYRALMRVESHEARDFYEREAVAGGWDKRTLERWRTWWLENFAGSRFWKSARARFVPRLNETVLPLSLVDAFKATVRGGMARLLEFISPITIPSRKGAAAM